MLHIYASDVGTCRQSLYGVVGCEGCLFGLCGIVKSLSKAVAFGVKHRDTIVQIYLIFGVVLGKRHLYAFLILHQSRVGLAQPAVGYAHSATQIEHGVHVMQLLCQTVSALSHAYGISHTPHVDKRHCLFAQKPASGSVRRVHQQGTVGKGQCAWLVTSGVEFGYTFEHGVSGVGR